MICKNCETEISMLAAAAGVSGAHACQKCHHVFCKDCLTLQRDLEGEADPVQVCFTCDGVGGAAGHQRRQRMGVA